MIINNQVYNTMKKLFFLTLLIIPILIGCNEDDSMDSGVITGIDVRECSCCGGFFIDIKDSTYRFQTLPAGSNIDLINNPNFPINVELNWKMKDTLCLGDEIIVLKISRK